MPDLSESAHRSARCAVSLALNSDVGYDLSSEAAGEVVDAVLEAIGDDHLMVVPLDYADQIRADERARIAAYLRSRVGNFETATQWLDSHGLMLGAGSARVIHAAVQDIEKGRHLEHA